MCAFCEGGEDVTEAAARILAGEVRRLEQAKADTPPPQDDAGGGDPMLTGELVRAGTMIVGGEEITGYAVSSSIEELRKVRHLPMYRRVAIVPEELIDGWTVPAVNFDRVYDALRALRSACRSRLTPASYGQIDDALAEADTALTATSMNAAQRKSGSRAKVVCLIGSTRFYREFRQAECDAEIAGEITVGPAFTPDVADDKHGGTVGLTPEQKAAVDLAFVHKIAMADEVLVINVGGYVGESTRRDIETARSLNKPIRWLEPNHAF